jgi:hypothetical protein
MIDKIVQIQMVYDQADGTLFIALDNVGRIWKGVNDPGSEDGVYWFTIPGPFHQEMMMEMEEREGRLEIREIERPI